MRIFMNSLDFDPKDKPTAIGLGTFDGLHVGHMKLIGTLLEESGKRNLTSAVYTFKGEPDDVLKKGCHTHVLTDFDTKADLLDKTGVSILCVDDFTPEYAATDAEKFIAELLVGRLGMKLAVCGFNYTFGRYKKGDVGILKTLSEKYDFDLIVIPPVEIDGEIISSTLIRKTIAHGDVTKASVLMGRYFSLKGTVVPGRQVGRKIGIPTANLEPSACSAVPARGVYATKLLFEGNLFDSVTNIGFRPTFESSGGNDPSLLTVETHMLDHDRSFYGKEIEVFFYKRIRSEQKFTDVDKLIGRIREDITEARAFFASFTTSSLD